MNDLRYAFRQLFKNPGFAAVAVLTLALGIGANTAIFSVVNSVLLRPLSFPDSDRLLWVSERGARSDSSPVSFPNYADWRKQQTVFEEIGVYNWGDYNLTESENPSRLRAAQISATALAALGTQPSLGRVFTPDEDKPGAPNVALLSAALWRERFGSDPAILDRPIHLDGNAYTVVGIMPSGFVFPDPVDLWLPLGPRLGDAYRDRDSHPGLEGVARLKPGVTLQEAREQMDAIAARLEQQYPESNRGARVRMDPLLDKVVGGTGKALWMLLGAVSLVLLVACANVANLLLARAAARHKEVALRIALGAGRWRIVRQLLTESLLLAAIGGGLGLLLAYWSLELILALGHDAIPRVAEVRMDGGILAFTALTAAVTGVLFGLAPAWQSGRAATRGALTESARGNTDGKARMRQGLIVAEVSLTLVLLVGAGLLVRSFQKLQSVNPGFSSEHVLCFWVSLPQTKYSTPDQQDGFFQSLVGKLKSLPGVQAAGVASRAPLQSFNWLSTYRVGGRPEPMPGEEPTMDISVVSPGYFQVMGMPLLRGRAFTEQDNRDHLRGDERQERSRALNVVIVDEDFVRRHWPDENPIGKQIRLPWGDDPQKPLLTVVGVVGRVKMRKLGEKGGFAQAYLPAWQLPELSRTVIVRTAVPPDSLSNAIREQVRALDPVQPVSRIRTVDDLVSRSLAPQRLNLALLGVFAGSALLLAAIGLYGVLSYSVTQRSREIGVRMALGARRSQVVGLVIKHGMKWVLMGIGLGLGGVAALTRIVQSLLFEVSPMDPLILAGMVGLLSGVALLACAFPACRAAKTDPMESLRSE